MDILAAIYDTVFNIFHQTYFFIFTTLLNDGGYLKFVLVFLLIPLFCWFLFYFVWRYPYGRWWHWLIWLIITTLIVFGSSFGVANNEILASNNPDMINCYNDPDCMAYAASLPIKYAQANLLLSLFVSFIYSMIMKQFSKVQIHLPF